MKAAARPARKRAARAAQGRVAKRSISVRDVVEFASLLQPTWRALSSAYPRPAEIGDALTRGGLGNRHAPALLVVALQGPMSVSELARRVGLGLSTTSTLVVELSGAGFVERSEDERDRRRTIVALHEDHRDAVDAWAGQAFEPIRRTLSQLTPATREQFMQSWRKLHAEAIHHATGGNASAAGELEWE